MLDAIEQLERAIRGHEGRSILQTLARLSLGEPLDDEQQAVLNTLAEIGIGRPAPTGFKLNKVGHKCADAAREYILWMARGRQLHWEDTIPALSAANFADKRVLEIGPGWGCNLFRLQQVTPYVRGREVEETYVRFTSIFASMEGVAPPAIDLGGGEDLPYADESFDYVLLFSVMQYLDVKPAIHEIVRVLAPGGRVLTSQPLLPELLADLSRAGPRPRALAHGLISLINSLSYELFTRRLVGSVPSSSTGRPVYLTRRKMVSIIENAGLKFLESSSAHQELGREFILVAEKPGTPEPS